MKGCFPDKAGEVLRCGFAAGCSAEMSFERSRERLRMSGMQVPHRQSVEAGTGETSELIE